MEELIINVGIDAKHSFEDSIQTVEDFSKKYGHRLGVIGGIDMELLVRGTIEEVRKRTRQILETCAISGGYLLGSGNSLADFIPRQNYLAMLFERQEFL